MADKATLRAEMYEKRRLLSTEEAQYLSELAQNRLMQEKVWKKSRAVALYSPIRKETQTRKLMDHAWHDGKQVLLPRTVPGPHRLIQLLPCNSFDALVPGAFGILEPDPATCPPPENGDILPDLIVVPGVGYDRHGYRLGNGGGYYDRFFARHEIAPIPRIGIAYSFQLVDTLPGREAWDLPMHGVCTDEELVWIKKP
ncbi:5-formyltetrahydrofolate cyclo-ligase [Desulfovibrio sp. OttesenSCG-928-I05]|nr:5-formyltetrahydrofolate cyclo-ligase [Desulfovibrio sp. OttesenSCG-928-I05]